MREIIGDLLNVTQATFTSNNWPLIALVVLVSFIGATSIRNYRQSLGMSVFAMGLLGGIVGNLLRCDRGHAGGIILLDKRASIALERGDEHDRAHARWIFRDVPDFDCPAIHRKADFFTLDLMHAWVRHLWPRL